MEYLRAFVVGGALCVLAQILIDKTRMSPGRILVIYVVAGAALGAVGFNALKTGSFKGVRFYVTRNIVQ